MYILCDLVRSPIRGRLGDDGGEGDTPTSGVSLPPATTLPSRAARAFLRTSTTFDPNFPKISARSWSRSSSVIDATCFLLSSSICVRQSSALLGPEKGLCCGG